jgi:DNA (cytosine-5)-methyltransferase 1
MSDAILTYISLFSSAGVGCYGFKQEGFECIATNELLEKRLKIQRYNSKCKYESGYILGDIREPEVYSRLLSEIKLWEENHGTKQVDAIIATPPCQGISVANHKKKDDEYIRNSLVVESLRIIGQVKPRFFILENVRGFLDAVCMDIDGNYKKIRRAIEDNLVKTYNLSYNIMNFKDYGCPSSRTRTIILGVHKSLSKIDLPDLYPNKQMEIPLRESIGHLPPLKNMGEICSKDIYHSFKKYDSRMIPWIENISEGQSAFDNEDISRLPHTVKDGVVKINAYKNGDKYRRQYWNKVAPCIHTRNDILSSQNTIHPTDNRVFSIRELMLLMSIPNKFKWTDVDEEALNVLQQEEKEKFLKREETNIRQSIGEGVPTIIFRQIAANIKHAIQVNGY